MKNFIQIFCLIAVLISFGCNNELEILEDYRETPIIYGLLNLADSDSIQYVRVEKAFLGKGDALIMAQQSDSSYYDTSSIKVVLEEYSNNIITSHLLFPDFSHPKEQGIFSQNAHYVFRTLPFALNETAIYKLIFNNKKSGLTANAVTGIVGKVLPPFILQLSFINIPIDDDLEIPIAPVNNGKIYALTLRFNYVETKNGVDTKKLIEFKYPENLESGAAQINFNLMGIDFYNFVGSHIPVDPNVIRLAQKVNLDFIFSVGAEDLYIYYTLLNQSGSATDFVPEFTNINGGKGIFSSRNNTGIYSKQLNTSSLDLLRNSVYTTGRFQ